MAQDDKLVEALSKCDQDTVLKLVRQQIAAGTPATDIIAQCNRGMGALGDRFARNECYLPELMVGGMIMKSVTAELAPLLAKAGPAAGATVVMGSVLHDVHDIGKDIVIMMLRGIGLNVIDLGVNVSPDKFVQAIRQHAPVAVGMSVLLTTCFKSVTATMEAIKQAALRDQVKIMVGGAAASDLLAQSAGCDFYGKTAVDGMKFVQRVICEK